MNDNLVIVTLTMVACAVVGLIGAWLLHATRRRSFRNQLMIATFVPVLAVVASVLVNVRFMFLSRHDSVVMLLALAISLGVAVAVAYLLTRRLASASEQVGAGVRRLAEEETAPPRPGRAESAPGSTEDLPAMPQELAQVVTDLEETRRRLAEARGRERAAERSRRELISFMSHDLRTPLAGLRALSEGLEDGVITDVPAALGHLSSTVNRMTGLVDDLFALARVQGPPQRKQERMVSLREILSDVAAEAASTAAARTVTLDLDVPADDRLAVLGSPEDLTRALANLVANAIRHTKPGLTVRLLGQRGGDGRVQVAVVDACGGSPPDYLPRVFDTGWRGSPSRGGDDGRAGLGLAIARGVVQSHAGQIAVRNVDGGCRFEVDLPSSPRETAP